MARRLKPAKIADIKAVEDGLQNLIEARELFKRARAPKTVERIRLAISSGKGALRHVITRQFVTSQGGR